jgi:hypothetical protein
MFHSSLEQASKGVGPNLPVGGFRSAWLLTKQLVKLLRPFSQAVIKDELNAGHHS